MAHNTPRREPSWKTHEKISFLFETLLRPLETTILHDTRQRDLVGVFRQLDVGVIDDTTGERRVKSFVEVQKRETKATLDDLGNWEYKRQTLGASEITIVSEAGFTDPLLKHVRTLHTDTIRLGLLRPVQIGLIESFNATILGIIRVLDIWWFGSIFVQYADKDEIVSVPLPANMDYHGKIFGHLSPMDLVNALERKNGEVTIYDRMIPMIFDCGDRGISYENHIVKRILITIQKTRQRWEPETMFFTYSGVYPKSGQIGIAIISECRSDLEKNAKFVLVILPEKNDIAENYARITGQIELSENRVKPSVVISYS